MALEQQSLFADEEVAPKPKPARVNPEMERNKLKWFVSMMRESSKWPWGEEQLRVLRETVWPQSYAALPPKEAAKFRAEIEAECARFDAAKLAA